jgi:long-chain fatty acid transport protein
MISRLSTCWLVTACFVLIETSEQSALAQGVVRDSIAATPSGRGGTNIAHFDNLSVILDNPAGLANLPERARLDFGIDLLFTDLDYTDPLNNADAEVVPFPLPQFAYARKAGNDRFAYGLGVFAPAGFGAHYDLRHALYGKREYSSLGALVKILPAAACKLGDRLSLGATFGLAASHAQLEKPLNLQTGLLAGLPCMADIKATGFAPTWSVGMQYRLSDQTTLGLAFRSETRFRLRGDAKVDVSGIGVPLLKASYDAEVDLVWPRSLGAGITHWLGDKHRVSADVVWFDWSHAFDKLDLKLTDGSNPLFRLILGPKVRDTLPLDWRDSVAFRAGYEFFPTSRDVLRAGYVYHRNPIPAATLIPNLAGTLEHAVSLGYGHKWKRWGLDVAYQYSWGPTNYVSCSRMIGGDYDHSSVKAQAHWLFVSFSCSF